MKYNPDTVCLASWFQVRNTINNELKCCCQLDTQNTDFKFKNNNKIDFNNFVSDSEYLTYVRENLTQGNRLKECNQCWSKERNGVKSLRQQLNDMFTYNRTLENSWFHSYMKNKTDYSQDLLLGADLILLNLCNYSCAMCIPHASSKIYSIWKKNLENEFVKAGLEREPDLLDNIKENFMSGINYRLLQTMLDNNIRYLKILGGEPLMDEKLLKMLDGYDNRKNCHLHFITNGSRSIKQIAERFSEYKCVTFSVSIDGIEEVQDFIRRGSNWNTVKQHVLEFGNIDVSIHCTVQALNFVHLHKLASWCQQHELKLSLGILDQPAYMKLDLLPEHLIEQGIESILPYTDCLIVEDEDTGTQNQIFDFRKFILDNYTPDFKLRPQLKRYLDWYDSSHEWKNILPEWNSILR
jgi:organic radical activating enzyme